MKKPIENICHDVMQIAFNMCLWWNIAAMHIGHLSFILIRFNSTSRVNNNRGPNNRGTFWLQLSNQNVRCIKLEKNQYLLLAGLIKLTLNQKLVYFLGSSFSQKVGLFLPLDPFKFLSGFYWSSHSFWCTAYKYLKSWAEKTQIFFQNWKLLLGFL